MSPGHGARPTSGGIPTGLAENNPATSKSNVLAADDSGEPRERTSDNPWAERYICVGRADVPDYGVPEWRALADDDPRKVAACVRAAEAWRTYWSPAEHIRRVQAEIDANRGAALDETEQWLAERVKGAGRPRFSQLCEMRGDHERAARAREIEAAIGLDVVA